MTIEKKTELIKSISSKLGFDACGIAQVKELSKSSSYLKDWLDNGYQADMKWMENNFEKRIDPSKLVENSKSVIVLLKNYYPEEYPFENRKLKIARYAFGEDYHNVLKKKLKVFLNHINSEIGPAKGRYFVDSAPVLERAWAKEAGLGWIGKNSMLINKKIGSFCFIAEIITDIELVYDSPINNYCGTCTKCIEACPTGAIVKPYIVDSNKCISYHTIENKCEIPENISINLNGHIFGCDICQEVCPWNNKARPSDELSFNIPGELRSIKDNDWLTITEEKFNKIFTKSAVKRTGYDGLKRNIKAASQ